ncbi:TetR family transcriptional regulator [Isoptericola sp. b490]|uniref:TetR/AcrR family transcriptional regulator n=1 Tax=Actinotalea lenta TaxID=3064654 RepID=UPI002713FF98|nr:TetR family transcriptional regulator [Isoptericola sp. b490]MDO8121816.1 TetR family transcriptional regulator [Isoptericola sp. b490]
MRSAPISDDVTARARIRDAAIRRFAADGFRAGVRAIAADAGVSPALVLHHFGSKDGLRRACDEHVLAVVAQVKTEALATAGPDQLLAQMAAVEELAPLVAYQLRSMLAGGDLARALLEDFMTSARQWVAAGVEAGTLRPSRDEEARVRYLTLSGFGGIVGWMAIDPPQDFGDLGPWLRRYMAAVGLPAVELFTDGLFADRRMLDAYLSYVGDPPDEQRERTA